MNEDAHLESDFDYKIHAHVIAILDLNAGGKPCKENMKAILGSIIYDRDIDISDYTIILFENQEEFNYYNTGTKSFSAIPFHMKAKCLKLIP